MIAALLTATPLGAGPLAGDEWTSPSGEFHDAGLRVRSIGKGAGTILLLHGLAGSNQYFGGEFDALAQEARVVVPDLLGFGDSPRPEDVDYGPDAHARAVISALEALRIEGPIYVAAHSAGSIVALRLAELRPAWVRGIVAFGPPLYRSEKEARARMNRLGALVQIFALDTVWARLACNMMHAFPYLASRLAGRIRKDLPPSIAADAVKHSWSSYSRTVRNLVLMPQPPAELSRLRVPVWLIAGAEDQLVDIDFLKEIANSHRFVELEIWSGGHDLPLSDASRSIETIQRMVVIASLTQQ